jgi:uncharacterized protein YndB with AHSA1/START domain
MAAKSNLTEDISDREIVSTRVFAAPRELVYAAFSDPSRLVQWWGPKGFTSTFHQFDLRPGGQWRLTLHGPDGTDHPNDKEFLEVRPLERIVFHHRQSRHGFRMTMTFAAQGEQTAVTWLMQFESAADLAPLKRLIAEANEQNLDRLAHHLQLIQQAKT